MQFNAKQRVSGKLKINVQDIYRESNGEPKLEKVLLVSSNKNTIKI